MQKARLHKKYKLLITEDDHENQKFLEAFLKKYFEITFCDSGESFHGRLREDEFDLILMNISIKGEKTGIDLIREMRAHPIYSQIPIVCHTAHVHRSYREQAFDAGCNGFIVKPADTKLLLSSLFEHLPASFLGKE